MNRIDRLVSIITTLQAKNSVTANFIADKYGISVRTVYRDLKALGEMGVPIAFKEDVGYSIEQNYFLPPIRLSSEEANALILVSSLSAKFSDPSTIANVDNALEKIKAVLGSSQKHQADTLQSQIRIYNPPDEPKSDDYLTEIQGAITCKELLSIEYVNNQSEQSEREIEPIGLTFYSNQWHLIAWCWKRLEYRDFKVRQIGNLKNTKQSFRKDDHYNLNDYIRSLQ